MQQEGLAQSAIEAYGTAMAAEAPKLAAKAAFNLGVLYAALGDTAAATAAYRRAIGARHGDASPKAAFNLAVMLEASGDQQGARSAFRQALESGHPHVGPSAAQRLRDLRPARHHLSVDLGAPAGQRPSGQAQCGTAAERRRRVRGRPRRSRR